MATKRYEFTGPVKWAKVWPGQIDTKYETPQTGGKWSIIVNLGSQLPFFNALGTKTKAARLDDPERGIEKGDVQFKRNERHPRLGDLGPPKVTGVEDGASIGNGSICKIGIDVYDYPKPDGGRDFAIRLVDVAVLDHIPFVKTTQEEGPPL